MTKNNHVPRSYKALGAVDETSCWRVCPLVEKPPIGLRPFYIYAEQCELDRLFEIVDAIKRYNSAGHSVPGEWYEELKDIASIREKEANRQIANMEPV